VRLKVHEWGDPGGRPVVCLHGLTARGHRFRRLAGELPGLRLFAPELRGHGESGREPPWDVQTHVADVIETADGAGVPAPCDWIGFSFGGRIAATLAAARPKRVERLVLLDPGLQLAPAQALEFAEIDRHDVSFASFDEAIDAELASATLDRTPRSRVEEEMADDFVTRPDGRLEPHWLRSMAVTAWSEMSREPPPVAHVPTLIVLADRSYIEVDVDRYRDALGERLTVVTVPGGHSVMWEALEETAGAVRAFFDRPGTP
jgi:lipase